MWLDDVKQSTRAASTGESSCKRCGTASNPGSKFCHNCGVPQAASVSQPASVVERSELRAQKNSELRRRAREGGVSQAALDAAMDADDTKEALVGPSRFPLCM